MPRIATRAGDLCLITGGTGRIGANLSRELLSRGYRVRALTLPKDPGVRKLSGLDVEVVEADLRDAAATAHACAGVDAICHLAALMGPDAGEMPVQEYWGLNVDATLNVLEGARQNGRLVKFLFASTDATYPAVRPRYTPIDENHPQDPVNLYGLTKVVGEKMCLDYLTEFAVPTTILRFGAVASPDERATGAAFKLSGQIARFRDAKRSHNNYLWVNVQEHERPWEWLEPHVAPHEQLVALTDLEGRPWRSHPTDVRDIVQGVVLALESPASLGEAFNILGPSAVASTEAAAFLSERLGIPWRPVEVPLLMNTEISTTKARLVLGYRPRIDFFRAVEDGLKMLAGEDVGVTAARPPQQ